MSVSLPTGVETRKVSWKYCEEMFFKTNFPVSEAYLNKNVLINGEAVSYWRVLEEEYSASTRDHNFSWPPRL